MPRHSISQLNYKHQPSHNGLFPWETFLVEWGYFDLRRLVFGAKSEKAATIEPKQAVLDLGDVAPLVVVAANDGIKPAPARTANARRPASRNIGALPLHLPRCEVVIDPTSLECPCCASRLHRIGEDISEALDVVPAILRVIRTIRPKYACRACEDTVVQGKARPRLIEAGMATTALVTHVVVAKFAWHLPLYRQSQIFAGYGVHIDRGTLGFWVKKAAWWLKPLYQSLLRFIRSQPRLFCDETPLPRLDPGRGRTKVCQLWAQAVDDRPWQGPSPPAIGYVFAEGRGTAEVKGQLAQFSGVLQVDGYAAYKALVKRRARSNAAPLKLAFCLAHARRKFVQVVKVTGSQEALAVLATIGEIYGIEARIRGSSAEIRCAVRQQDSAPLMAALKGRLCAVATEISTKSALGKAITYTLAHWEGLIAFLDDGRIEVDSNTVERSMRSIGLGRKNSLFAGNAQGGETWAILASLINTAKLNGLDPQTWLTDVLERMVSGSVTIDRIDELLPWAWKAQREIGASVLERAAA